MPYPKLKNVIQVACYYGIGFCLFRAKYAVKRKLGLLRRKCPGKRWSEITLDEWIKPGLINRKTNLQQLLGKNRRAFFFDSNSLPKLSSKIDRKAVFDADLILQNNFRYFFDRNYDLGSGPDWFLNPLTGGRINPNLHWTETRTFDPKAGDIKFIWEPSRFAWVYTLVRAFAATGAEKYAHKFWSLFESWLSANQPNIGPNYACGQECAIRLMAMCFALYGLSEAHASTPERKESLILAIAVHAERIEKNIEHAISTRTNHSLTESAGLYTAGLMFPELKRSKNWVKLGKKIFANELLKQIYNDGSYIQHSMNYHRLMLQDCLWTIRLAELNNDSFCDELISRVAKAVEFLYQMQDEKSARVPNYGANDGALILPLNSCDYLDYRPIIQSCWYLCNREKLYDSGPWDEDLLWLFGPEATKPASVNKKKTSGKFASGGYYTIRSDSSWAMIRCHTYLNRVSHIDPLHLDLWADGANILRDCGSYLYFAPDEPHLEVYFKSIWSHNTVIVDDVPPLQLVSRFMWLPWPKAELLKFETSANRIEWEGKHLAYNRSPWHVVHFRKVTVEQDRWEIIDRLCGQGRHRLELRWHLPNETKIVHRKSDELKLQLSKQWNLQIGDSGEIESELLKSQITGGWESLYYGRKQSINTLSVKKYCPLPTTFKTTVWKESLR